MNVNGPVNITWAKLRPDGAWHAVKLERASTFTAICGQEGEIIVRTEADSRAVRVSRGPVCGNCRDQLDAGNLPARYRHDAGERSTTVPTATRTKAPSRALVDRKKYAAMSEAKLREERTTINNRLSGVKTQLGRIGTSRAAGDVERRRELKDRQADLEERRALIGRQLEERFPAEPRDTSDANAKLASATKMAAGEISKAASRNSRTRGGRRKK